MSGSYTVDGCVLSPMFRNKRNYNTIQIILSWSKHCRPFWIMAIPLSPSSSHPGGTKATTATALPHISYSSGWLAWVASIQTSPVKLWSALNQLKTKQGWWVYSSVVKWGQTVDAQCSRGVYGLYCRLYGMKLTCCRCLSTKMRITGGLSALHLACSWLVTKCHTR